MKLRPGQKFNHFDGKDHCVCVITKIVNDERVYLKALSPYFTDTWWDTYASFTSRSKEYYYEPHSYYKSKLGKILYK